MSQKGLIYQKISHKIRGSGKKGIAENFVMYIYHFA